MGFSDHGKQCLHPEEALYLMECGNLQLFYQDLPLSIQEGYERFLYSKTMSIQHYQVFGHLKRLGYVVNRFDPSSVPSQYERQLNLPQSQDRSGRLPKRKRSHSPTSSDYCPMGNPAFLPLLMHIDKIQTASHPQSSPRWDFSSIPFPDLGSRCWLPSSLTSPDPCLLPGAVGSVGACDVAPWLQRLNLREVRMSRREWERERDRDRNWAEYQELQERRIQRSRRDRPAHLWEGPVTPLHDPAQVTSTEIYYIYLSMLPALFDFGLCLLSLKGSEEWRICFNIYQPDTVTEFKKSALGKPYSRMCVCSFDGPVPDLWTLKLLAFQSGDVPVTYAVVDHGDISFYSFKDFQIPTDVSF
uniref:TSEN54 tRNA splicing endonuclease subunit n=1 Tax=Oncorhynchus mykiss TaxID=8022 RepID=A0A8C7NUV6_ONCMY